MFTSLSANVGFNPLLAGALACRHPWNSACHSREAGDWGLTDRGRGTSPEPSVAWLRANGNGFSRSCVAETMISTITMNRLLTQMIGKCLPVLLGSMPSQEKKHHSRP